MKKCSILFLVLTLLITPLYGTSITDKKNQLNSAQNNISGKKELLEDNTGAQEALEAEIKRVDLQIVEIQDTIDDLEEKLQDKEIEIEESQALLEEATKKKDEQYESAKARMVQMYKNRRVGYLQIIFSSNNFWEAINRIEYIRRISKQDDQILKEYEKQITIIDNQKKTIENEKAELDILRKAQVAKKSEMQDAKNSKDKALEKLAQEEGKLLEEIAEMEAISKKLEEDIKKLIAASTVKTYSGGAFLWPVPGFYRISSEYNPRTSPISGNYEFHTGIDIPASYGKDVVAAADGVVITSGWVRGYGNTIMINHGSGLVTLYGHNSSLIVSNGQTVTKGQPIARIGSTGYSTGNHCHFEVRLNGSHISPWKYLKN